MTTSQITGHPSPSPSCAEVESNGDGDVCDVSWVVSNYYADRARFPAGSVEYDCTLVMRDLPHEWEPWPAPCVSAETQVSHAMTG